MRKLQYTLLILCFLCPQIAQAQRRFEMAERWEYQLQRLNEFTTNDVGNKTDAFWGLHTSQYAGSHHLLGFSAEGSWTSFMSNMPQASMRPGGWASGFHIIYEYQYSGLIIQTGVGVNFQRVYTDVADTAIYHYHMLDTWQGVRPEEFTLKHTFYNRRDMAQQLYGQLPLYVGHYLLSRAGIGYWLAGLHVNYAILGSTAVHTDGSTTGLYEKYLGIWQEMDNHGFRKDVPLDREGARLDYRLDVMAHAEMGYEWTTYRGPHNYRVKKGGKTDIRIRVGGFVDAGILNIRPKTNNTLYDIPMETIYDFPTYRMAHVFSTEDAKTFWMRNLYAGVRLTVLFGFPGREHCILCDPWRH